MSVLEFDPLPELRGMQNVIPFGRREERLAKIVQEARSYGRIAPSATRLRHLTEAQSATPSEPV